MNQSARIFIAGHRGLVGSAVTRRLEAEGYAGVLTATRDHLDLRDQVKLVDMARNLIRLSGFVPDEEIPIVFTGLRPGEKLFEELVGDDERSEPSGVEKILRVWPGTPARLDRLTVQIAELERLAVDGDVAGTLRQLAYIVPAFQPDPAPASDTPVTQV